MILSGLIHPAVRIVGLLVTRLNGGVDPLKQGGLLHPCERSGFPLALVSLLMGVMLPVMADGVEQLQLLDRSQGSSDSLKVAGVRFLVRYAEVPQRFGECFNSQPKALVLTFMDPKVIVDGCLGVLVVRVEFVSDNLVLTIMDPIMGLVDATEMITEANSDRVKTAYVSSHRVTPGRCL